MPSIIPEPNAHGNVRGSGARTPLGDKKSAQRGARSPKKSGGGSKTPKR